jgi:hypothetical protein
MLAALLPAAPPVTPPVTTGAAQLYVVPAGTTPLVPSTGVTLKPDSLHAVAVIGVIVGLGLTVTVTVKSAPTQLPSTTDEVGVTVYVAVCTVFVGLVRVPVMPVPLPAAPPVMPPVTTGTPQT